MQYTWHSRIDIQIPYSCEQDWSLLLVKTSHKHFCDCSWFPSVKLCHDHCLFSEIADSNHPSTRFVIITTTSSYLTNPLIGDYPFYMMFFHLQALSFFLSSFSLLLYFIKYISPLTPSFSLSVTHDEWLYAIIRQ